MADNVLKHDFSTPEILERVWERVRAAIDADERRAELKVVGNEIDDETLELLSAAGDVYALHDENGEL